MNPAPSIPSKPIERAPADRTPWWRNDCALATWLILALVLTYARVWHAGFIWDDDMHVTANPTIVGPLGLAEIWTSAAANYFPLVLTNFWLLHAAWGLDPLPYHLMNVAMHAMCAVLLWRVLRRLHVRGAWLGAALWALHPVQVESVAWISELKNTQSCVFFLLAALFFLRWLAASATTLRSKDYALVVLCALLAILSKPSTVMLPVALLLCAWWQTDRFHVRHLVALLPLFFFSAVASGWTIWEQKFHSFALGPEWNQTLAERCVIAGRAIGFYLGKLVWPHPIIFIYPRWELATGVLGLLPLVTAGLAAALMWRARPHPAGHACFFAFAYFIALLFPVLGFFNVYFFRYSFVADHFQYLASIGPLALAASGLVAVSDRLARFHRTWGIALPAAAVLTLALVTWRETHMYRNALTLWQATHERNPSCWMATTILGNEAADRGDYAGALRLHEAALRLNPDAFEVRYNFGLALKKLGRLDEAIAAYRRALELKPNFPEAEHNIGVALAAANRLPEAIPHYEQALRLKPDQPETHFSLALALTLSGRPAEAVAHYEAALRLRPAYAEAHYGLARSLQDSGETAAALGHYREAVRLKPDFAAAQVRLAAALASTGAWPEAVVHYEQAAQLEPDDADSVYGLAVALANTGHTKEAIPHYERALQLRPDHAEAHCNLANALFSTGQVPAAIAHYEHALQLNPRLAEAHYDFAVALQAASRLRDAKEHAAAAARLQPGLPPIPGLDK